MNATHTERESVIESPVGYMVVAVRPSYREPGSFDYGAAGGITPNRDAAENHRAYCEMSAEADPGRYGTAVEYRVMVLVERSSWPIYGERGAVEEWETYIEEAIASTSERTDLIERLRATIEGARR